MTDASIYFLLIVSYMLYFSPLICLSITVKMHVIFRCLAKENQILSDSEAMKSPTTKEVRVTSVLEQSTSVSEDHLSHKSVSGVQSTSSPTGGTESTACVPPPNSLISNRSISDNSISLANNGYCSPDDHLPHEKPKYAGISGSRIEANVALTSFEVILGSLTRTKDSIGRATRIAIECAKLGVAAKVCHTRRSLELLTCILFFLFYRVIAFFPFACPSLAFVSSVCKCIIYCPWL